MATVKEIYKITKDLMFEKASSKIYDDYLVSNVNFLLGELFEENNVNRVFKNKEKLSSPQIVSSWDDTLTYEDDIVYSVLPIGLAAHFFIDDDLSKYSIFYTMYNNARVANQKLVGRRKLNAS